MKKLLSTSTGRLRAISFLEGISLIVLLGITMPLKYALGLSQVSFAAGLVHGVLFLLFALMLTSAAIEHRWKALKIFRIVLFACLLPFGFIYADKIIVAPQQAL